jgi:S-adenosylmethionine:tRNA ribosyltransferase-isomerase
METPDEFNIDAYDYELPELLIAQEPAPGRDGSRLLVLDRKTGGIEHRRFPELEKYLNPGDVLVINTTRVFPARVFGKRATGGNVEVLFLRTDIAGGWLALVRGNVKPGEKVEIADGAFSVTVAQKKEEGWRLETPEDLLSHLEKHGVMPLPPYIKRERSQDHRRDHSRYQTVYAKKTGSAAAPTAGLHFTPEILASLESKGVEVARVVLHIGYETFRPIRVDDVREHKMHGEFFEIDSDNAQILAGAAREGRRIIPVGTTSCRVLETLAIWDTMGQATSGVTSLYIRPGFSFRHTGGLLTNFHLPRSSLLLLVSAMAGRKKILEAYETAVREKYRFYSYGDAMLII